MHLPWLDHRGRLSPAKAVAFAALFAPGLANALWYAQGELGARPITELIHVSGLWAIRLLFLSLAITPLRQVLREPRLVTLRRMIGVAAFCYGALHLTLDAADKTFDLAVVLSEIVLRVYLAIGATALLVLAALAATSTDGMLRRLGGRRWQRLHRGAYVAGLLATVHFFLQSKIDTAEPTVMAGLFLWLMGYRALLWRGGVKLAAAPRSLLLLSFGAAVATALGEATCYGLFTGIDPVLVLRADLTLDVGLRPAWIVLAISAAVAVVTIARDLNARPLTRPARS